MILTVKDGNGVSQTISVKTQESAVDNSGSIASTGVSQQLLAANTLRSGWVMQNLSSNNMNVNVLGVNAVNGAGSFTVSPGSFFPPADFPLTTSVVNVLGTAADEFTCLEW